METKRHYRVKIDGRDMGLFYAAHEGGATSAAADTYRQRYAEEPPRHSYRTPWEVYPEVPGWLIGQARRAYQWAIRLEVDGTLAPDLRRLLRDLRMGLHVAMGRKTPDAEEAMGRLLREARQIADGWGLEGLPE